MTILAPFFNKSLIISIWWSLAAKCNGVFPFIFDLTFGSNLYFSFARSHREPNRTDYENGNPIPEKLNNFELGLRKTNWSLNIYYMRYKDQLVLTGEIDEVGFPIRQNVGDSYRLGIEFDSNFKITKRLSWAPNLSLSENKNIDFYFRRDGILTNLGETNISFSPNIVAGSIFNYGLNEKTKFKDLNTNDIKKITEYVLNTWLLFLVDHQVLANLQL